ncbi:glycoside hydrolase family 127 protein [Gracilibacillus alcaliphilus]|uniref:glycoside hydrolase family 127 protein n=1 Tax=Gracilibacillus alcaliphilus TaxID=1401441 RepID=UPI001959626D|nr:glycoside hydrolase family 127 protein [Gracilibacillus alcaliphilus]MBM7678208.1 DUF1680 family protein [Gracilibacillus alcaliphilus]
MIHLHEGIFRQSQQRGKEYLLYLDVDRLIAPCYEAAGHKAKKERYGGWESKQIAGHSLGHWLSAAAEMYQVIHDQQLLEKVQYALNELAKVQEMDSTGYVSGFSRDCFDQVFTGDFEVSNFSLGNSWVPWYSIHKIYAGLIDVYQSMQLNLALEIVLKLAEWAYQGLNQLTEKQMQRMLICEHGGMNEVFADLYLLTNDPRYLHLAERFCHQAVLEPLADQEDQLEGRHANTQIPKVIGAAKLYNITGKQKYKTMATFFWEQVVRYRSYAIGGNSIREHFGIENEEELGVLTTETCNTYNMLKLTEVLFDWDHSSHYYDFYERALYNHILASDDPDTGMKTYFVSSEPGHFKVYHSPDNSFWCCTGTGMENPARYNRRIMEKLGNCLYVHLFIASKASFDGGQTVIQQATDFPYQSYTNITIEQSGDLDEIAIRKPYWLTKETKIHLNGEPVQTREEKGYIVLTGDFQKGDTISVELPIGLHLYHAKDDPHKQVIMYGPLVLAGALGQENYPETDILEDHLALNNHPLIEVPVITTEQSLEQWVRCIDQQKLLFEIDANVLSTEAAIMLKPFYAIHHERYTIYWNRLSQEQLEKLSRRKRQQELDRLSIIDEVVPGEQQPEIEHHLETKNSYTGYHKSRHSSWRAAARQGFFCYSLRVKPEETMYLEVTYSAAETEDQVGKVLFEVKVDQHLLAAVKLEAGDQAELLQSCYLIPAGLLKDKTSINVSFEAQKDGNTGKVYYVAITNQKRL